MGRGGGNKFSSRSDDLQQRVHDLTARVQALEHRHTRGEKQMSQAADDLKATVASITSVSGALRALTDKLFGMMSSSSDPVMVQAASDLKAEQAEIIATTLRDTPADPAAEPDPNAPPVA